ncbi:MAG: hypothetical protein Q9228_006484 [Teloschistes exilis]
MGFCKSGVPNCTLYNAGEDYPIYHADPDIAGIGVLLAFVTNSAVTISIAWVSFLFGIIRGYEENALDVWILGRLQRFATFRPSGQRTAFWQPVVERLILTLSDQQLLVGIAILTAGFLKHCSISVYHFAIVVDLGWFSSNTHMTTLFVLLDFFIDHPPQRDWRVALMAIILIAMIVASVLEGNRYWFDYWSAPAQCLWNDLRGNVAGAPAGSMASNIVLLVLGYGTRILRLYGSELLYKLFFLAPLAKMRHAFNTLQARRVALGSANSLKASVLRVISALGQGILWTMVKVFSGIGITLHSIAINLCFDIFWFAFGCWGLRIDRDIPASKMDGSENEWGFGQIVPVLLLCSTVSIFKDVYLEQRELFQSKESASEKDCLVSHNSVELQALDATATHEPVPFEELEPTQSLLVRADTEGGNRVAQHTSH